VFVKFLIVSFLSATLRLQACWVNTIGRTTCQKFILFWPQDEFASGSFYVKWTKKMEKSTHHLGFSLNLISRKKFSCWLQKTIFLKLV